MKIKFIILIYFFIFMSSTGFTQDQLISKDVLFYKVDKIGNVFIVDKQNALTKYEPSVPRYTKYADLKAGKIHSIDVSNPLRVVVYYADQFTIKFLDVNLTEISSYNLKDSYPEGWVRLVCASNNNGIWLYEELNRKLIKAGEQLNTQLQTGDLYLITKKKINPYYMIEYSDELFLCDSKNGIFVFDLLGGYKRSIPIYATGFISFNNQEIIYDTDKYLLKYSRLKTDTLYAYQEISQLQNSIEGFYYLDSNKNLYYKKN